MEHSSQRLRPWSVFVSAGLFLGIFQDSVRALERGCPMSDPAVLSSCLRDTMRETFDYSEFFNDSPAVLVFGEAHVCKAHRDELAAHMAELRKAGITHLAMEAYPVSRQDRLSAYKPGMAGLREELKEIQRSTLGADPESYARLIDAAAENGIALAGVDIDNTPLDFSGPDWRKVEAKYQEGREELWTRTIAGILRAEPGAKVLMLTGQAHISPENFNAPVRLQTRLRRAGMKTAVVSLEGGELFYDTALAEAARLSGLQSRRFLLKMDASDPAVSGDYHLHLPQDTNNILMRRRPKPAAH